MMRVLTAMRRHACVRVVFRRAVARSRNEGRLSSAFCDDDDGERL